MKNLFVLLSIVAVLLSCGNRATNDKKDVPVTNKDQTASKENKTVATGEIAGFSLNGTAAFNGHRNDEEPGAQLNAVNNYFSLTVYGDIAAGTKSGMMTISSKDFTPAAGDVKNAKASFTRYLDANGGKLITYGSGGEGSFTLHLSKCEQLPRGPVGDEWMISGTFDGKLTVSPIYANEAKDKELTITDGHFTDLKLIMLGKRK